MIQGKIETSAKKFAFLSKSTRNCKRLPSHFSQEQAYSMITRLVVCRDARPAPPRPGPAPAPREMAAPGRPGPENFQE